ncbi:uncharacterized protein LOC134274425 [Saccostrea cucullata]|uniref:uncharacterized protein LOC134274425 n=1 Tax=Saccostrea cuccullata TaxID=36930 RepID=UPI002ED3BB65
MMLRFIVLSALIIICHCFRQTRELPDIFKQKPEWDDFRVKWGFDPFNVNNFQSLPRRESDAKDARFELLRDECKEMEKGKERRVPLFKGKRYWKNKDPSVVVIYDANGYIAGVQAGFHKSAFENKNLQKKLKENLNEEERPVLHRRRRLANTDDIKTALAKGTIFDKRFPSITEMENLNNKYPDILSPVELYRSAMQSVISKRMFMNEELIKQYLEGLQSKEDRPFLMQNFDDQIRTKRHTDTNLEEDSVSSTPSTSHGTTRQSKPLPSTLHSRQSTPPSTENVFKKTTLSSGNSRSHERTRTFPETGQKSDSTAKSLGKSKAHRFPAERKAFEAAAKPSGDSKTSTQSDIFPPHFYHPNQEQYRSRFLRKAAKQPKKPHNENSETKSPLLKSKSNSPQNTERERKRSVSSLEAHHPVIHHTETHHPQRHHPVTHPFVEEDGVIFFTIYFIDPEHICDPERSRTIDHIEHWGTGSGLFIHNGTKSNYFIQIPRDERELQREGPWKPEKCFLTQGKMYSYNFDVNEDCHKLCPLLLYYNRGRLTGFALLFKMDYSSPYVEHPDKGLLRFMFEKVPKCYYEIGRLTKLHFFLTSNYLSHRC